MPVSDELVDATVAAIVWTAGDGESGNGRVIVSRVDDYGFE